MQQGVSAYSEKRAPGSLETRTIERDLGQQRAERSSEANAQGRITTPRPNGMTD